MLQVHSVLPWLQDIINCRTTEQDLLQDCIDVRLSCIDSINGLHAASYNQYFSNSIQEIKRWHSDGNCKPGSPWSWTDFLSEIDACSQKVETNLKKWWQQIKLAVLQRLSAIDCINKTRKTSSRETRNAELTRRLRIWSQSCTWSWTGFQDPVRNQCKQSERRKLMKPASYKDCLHSRQAAAAEASSGLGTALEWQMPCSFVFWRAWPKCKASTTSTADYNFVFCRQAQQRLRFLPVGPSDSQIAPVTAAYVPSDASRALVLRHPLRLDSTVWLNSVT